MFSPVRLHATREKFFTSQITTLPGPEKGLHTEKLLSYDKDMKSEQEHLKRKSSNIRDKFFESHINTLPGKTVSS